MFLTTDLAYLGRFMYVYTFKNILTPLPDPCIPPLLLNVCQKIPTELSVLAYADALAVVSVFWPMPADAVPTNICSCRNGLVGSGSSSGSGGGGSGFGGGGSSLHLLLSIYVYFVIKVLVGDGWE